MRLLFLSNYYNHHQRFVCEKLDELTNHDFKFVETEAFSDERRQMGWAQDLETPFVSHFGDSSDEELASEIENADCVIYGSAPLSLVKKRLGENKIVLKYSERVFKHGYEYKKWLPRLFSYRKLYGRHKSLYLLAASAYAAGDFSMHGTFRGKSYKWGYFPETKRYDTEKLFSEKQTNRILWCGRFLPWKHPYDAVEVAARLKRDGVYFRLDLIGAGELDEALRKKVEELGLSENVRFLGTMSPQEVRRNMETAGIYLFTSDFGEGWGAVLNEAMNSGCAVVASHAIGSVPFLLKNGENGLIYENGNIDELYQKTKKLLLSPSEQWRVGSAAYSTIVETWNAEVAASRLLKLYEQIERYGKCDLFEDGPCSRAYPLRNNWFEKKKGQQPPRKVYDD